MMDANRRFEGVV